MAHVQFQNTLIKYWEIESTMQRKKIAITGGLGFIGFNLANKIVELDPQVELKLIDNFSSGTKNSFGNHPRVEEIRLDISQKNIQIISEELKDVETVIHLSAFGNVTESVLNPWLNFENNVITTIGLLESMRQASVKKIVFASTGGAIMGNTNPPVNEKSVPNPISPYGSSKLACEAYLKSYSECYGISSIIFRFGNVYGKHSKHKNGIINKLILCAIHDEAITIRGNGSSTRDYIHVDDICDGITRGLDYMSKHRGNYSETFHLATGRETQINEVIQEIEKIHEKKMKKIYVDEIAGEVKRNFADSEKAKNMLDFTCSVDFSKGIQELYEWYID